MTATQRILKIVEPVIYGWRWVTLTVVLLLTAFFAYQTTQLGVDAGWLKMIPKDHPYMQTFMEYYDEFGGANRIIIAVHNKDGKIYEPEFMQTLSKVHEAVFFIPGVLRSRVTSIFSPEIMYIKNTPTGLSGASVIPGTYEPAEDTSEEMMATIRFNVHKANVIGRLVSNDETAALVLAELMEYNPLTDEEISYVEVGAKLEKIRRKFSDEDTSIHIIGFAVLVDEMIEASTEVIAFFIITLLIFGLLLWLYTGSFMLGMMPLGCSIVAVIWELGLLNLVGFGLDPFAILVPFLILAISASHGVQYVNGWANEIAERGRTPYDASLDTFRRLAIPGTVALFTAVAGFLTIYMIDIEVIRHMSINATLGVLAIIVTNKILMPILLTVAKIRDPEKFKRKQERREALLDGLWRWISRTFTHTPGAVATLVICGLILGWSIYKYEDLVIGTTQEVGVPQLAPDSRFNQDARFIASHFKLSINQLNVIAEAAPNSCIHYPVMAELGRFAWYMKNVKGVRETMTVVSMVKLAYSGLLDGRLNAAVIPRNRYSLAQTLAIIPVESGFMTTDCSAYNVYIFTDGTQAALIKNVVNAVKHYKKYEQSSDRITFQLASGNVGVKAATNEVIRDKELEIVLWVYAVILLFVFLSFRTLSGLICVCLPLALVSISAYGVMALLGIGLQVATLPVIAMGAGIGVDYGIYIYAFIAAGLRAGLSLEEAYYQTLRETGKAVIFIGLTLGISVATWLFSDLQFQVHMGQILVYMIIMNMFGAVFVLPALARFFGHEERKHSADDVTGGAGNDEEATATGSES